MIQRFGNKIVNFGNKVTSFGETLKFLITSNKFPLVVDPNNIGLVQFIFNKPTVVTVNYGNGVIMNYNSGTGNQLTLYDVGANVPYSPPPYAYSAYNYPDGLIIQRSVTISFDRNALTYFRVGLVKLDNQNFSFEFSKYPNLYSFGMVQIGLNQNGALIDLNLTNIPANAILREIAINRAFIPSSIYYYSIPLELFSFPLTSLGVGTSGLHIAPFSVSNLDKIANVAGTLTSLTLQGIALNDTNNGQGALPANFTLLTNLKALILATTLHTLTPTIINSITSLTLLSIGFNINFVSYGNISALVNLEVLQFPSNYNLTATIPSYFSNFIKIKRLDYTGFGVQTAGKLDILITNIYNLIISNASITGTAAMPFRSMFIFVQSQTIGDGTEIPSGIYQQPTGYIQGSSNGTPVSSKERIWVLQNQYSHTWTYKQS